jgi:hypothetical protein
MKPVYIVWDSRTNRFRWETIGGRVDLQDYRSLATVKRAIKAWFPRFRAVVYGVGRYAA